MKEMVGGCCVCSDEMGWNDNPLIYCDGPACEVAVHQGCYGIQEVPEGEWFCEKCRESTSFDTRINGLNGQSKPFRCELCPLGDGALKRTENGGWAHVVCALYIPEARFGDVHTMDPVILSEIPVERFNRTCYICAENNPKGRMGACMECHRPTCKKYFHVTCAQQKGLLCEETGISKTVKYCGFCHHHIKKGVADPSIKAVPPLVARPVTYQPTPPNSNNSGHMLVDPIHRPETINTVLGLASTEDGHLVNNFSPPLTTSSRSSVALDSTPPLSTPQNLVGVKVEMKEINGAANSSNSLSALMNMGQNHNRLAETVGMIPIHERNGHSEEKPSVPEGAYMVHSLTPSVSRPPIAVKRPRESMPKPEGAEKAKKPRVNHKKSSNMKSGEIDDFQALLDAVGPVVSETVSDFQRERVAVRSEAERRATQAVQPSTSAAHDHHESRVFHPVPNIPSTSTSHVVGSSPSTSKETNLPASMEALLERQWDQGAQLLLGQAQFDVSQLLTCLHQLKQENSRLEEQLVTLTKRREHLLALNSRLAVPLTSEPSHQQRHIHPHNNTINSPHHSPHVPPHSAADEMNQIRSLATNRMLATVQRPPSQANVAPIPQPTFATPQSRPPVSAAPVPSAPISTTPTSQNTTLSAAVPPHTIQDLTNISPERLAAALAAPMGLPRNFNLPQNPLLPPMNDIMAQLMLQQIGASTNRFNQAGASSLFLGNMMSTLNGPSGQNGSLAK